ncbi:MAG: hypothetical protein NVS1B16_03670 [Pseudarthrobacter sp.]
MSLLDEKLEGGSNGTKGRARATFAQLNNRWGQLRIRGDLAELTTMGKRERWVRTSGSGMSATYELQEGP